MQQTSVKLYQTTCHHISEDTTLLKKSTIIWDIMLCGPMRVNRRFGGTYRLLLQGESLFITCFHAGFLLSLFFDPEDGGDVLPKRRSTFNGRHGVLSQKMVLFITTAVRTSNPTKLQFYTITGLTSPFLV
jgi:hypothetical protein